MQLIKTIKKMKDISCYLKKKEFSLGFVPTMGYLHEGHSSLAARSKKQCDITVLSIFVNPAQFGPGEDYEKYPRDLERDKRIAKEAGVDYIFYPSAEEMYGSRYGTFITVKGLGDIMCGKFRPGHFDGVSTVVAKLLNIVSPDKAYFGQKDYQQTIIIRKMVSDLNLKPEIIVCPIVREPDGLAMSSRNKYLNPNERKNATILYRSLEEAAANIKLAWKYLDGNIKPAGTKTSGINLNEIKKRATDRLLENEVVSEVDYFEIRNAENLEEIKDLDVFYSDNPKAGIVIASAIRMGGTRLIDNMII
jgi:pantoate--beta-alanine ligase